MKVVHIITTLNIGGAEMMLFKLVKGVDRKLYPPVVISLMSGGELRQRFIDAGIEVYSLGMKRGLPAFSALKKMREIMQHVQPDVIQGWMYHGNFFSLLAKFFVKKDVNIFWNIRQCVYDLRNEKRLTSLVIRACAYFSWAPDKIIYNSKLSMFQHEGLGYRGNKSMLLPNGFDLKMFCPNESLRSDVRKELLLSEGSLLFGVIGRFHPMKDHYNFLCAAKQVLESCPHARFVMVGRNVCWDNEQLVEWIDALGLRDVVLLLGERKDIAAIDVALDVAVLSSNSEAFPNVVGEAMACATPCVVTDVGDAAYVVGGTGVVVPPNDANALASAMLKLADMSDFERSLLGERARERVEEMFSMEKVVQEYERLYSGELG